MSEWNQEKAVELCRKLEDFAPNYGCHVALTGGCLYKDGARKDVDILIYRIRQTPKIDIDGFFNEAKEKFDIIRTADYGWCHKAKLGDLDIDFFFPENDGEDGYGDDEHTDDRHDDRIPFLPVDTVTG